MPGYHATVISAIVSIPMSMLIVLTVALFPSMIRSKIFMEIILCISICDIMGNWPYALGYYYYPANGTAVCKFEGFCNLFFYPASWTYTTMLTYLLKSLLMYGLKPMQLSRWKIHCICLGVPLVPALAVLATNTYGITPSYAGTQVCSYGGNLFLGNTIHAVIYDGLLLLNFLIMIFFLVQLFQLARNNPILARSPAFVIVLRALCYYPIALIICWFPHVLFQLINFSYTDPQQASIVVPVFDCLKIMHGGIATIIFFHHSSEARSRWLNLLKPLVLLPCLPCCCCLTHYCGVDTSAFSPFVLLKGGSSSNSRKGNQQLLPTSLPISSSESDVERTSDSSGNALFRSSSQLNEPIIMDQSAFGDTPLQGNSINASAYFHRRSRAGSVNPYTTDKIVQSLISNSNTPVTSNDINVNMSSPRIRAGTQQGQDQPTTSASLSSSSANSREVTNTADLADWPQDSLLMQIFTQIAVENNVQSSTPFGVSRDTHGGGWNSAFGGSSSSSGEVSGNSSNRQSNNSGHHKSSHSSSHSSTSGNSGQKVSSRYWNSLLRRSDGGTVRAENNINNNNMSSSPYPSPPSSPVMRRSDMSANGVNRTTSHANSNSNTSSNHTTVSTLIQNLSGLFSRAARSNTHASSHQSNVSSLAGSEHQQQSNNSRMSNQSSSANLALERTVTETEMTKTASISPQSRNV